jgi:plasmid maintenance system antidote protein VapI
MRRLGPKLVTATAKPTIGMLFRGRIRERDLTVAALAKHAGVSYDYMYGVVNDREKLSIPVALKVAPLLGFDARELLVMQLQRKIQLVQKKMASTQGSSRPG